MGQELAKTSDTRTHRAIYGHGNRIQLLNSPHTKIEKREPLVIRYS